MNANERMDILNKFWGYGNPESAKILFIAIEEGGDWTKQGLAATSNERKERIANGEYKEVLDEVIEFRKKKYISGDELDDENPNHRERRFNSTERIQVYISMRVQGLLGEEYDADKIKRYWKDEFCKDIEFTSNIYPLAAKCSEHWPTEYEYYFGVSENKTVYREQMLETRIIALRELYTQIAANTNDNPLTFVMGKDIWGNIQLWRRVVEKVFGLSENDFNYDPKRSYGWNADKILLLYHPSYSIAYTNYFERICREINILKIIN